MKLNLSKFILLLLLSFIFSLNLSAQNQWFSMPSFWEVDEPGMAFNIESFDMNKDGHLDVVSGNWNDTYVYFGGFGILDETIDVIYTGRMLAVCDYNGDGFDDMIAMHFTNYDSSRFDYDGEILFYWGSDTNELAIDTIPDYSIPLPTLYPTLERFTIGYYTVGIQKGDLNGDGKCDLVLSSTQSFDTLISSVTSRGKIYIYLGKETPADTADYILIGQKSRAYIGDFVQVGNINGDDYDDLLISSNQPRTAGVAYDSINYLHIFYGSGSFTAIQGNESELYSSLVNPPDSTAGWFVRFFSVDDINGDGIDDLVIGRWYYSNPKTTIVHYGNINGIDTIPNFTFIEDTSMNWLFFSAGGVTQNIGDYNDDSYDDVIMFGGSFIIHFGGPHVSNNNRYGARGYSNGTVRKGVNMGDQTNDDVNDIAVIAPAGAQNNNGYILMLYGQRIPTDVEEIEDVPKDFNLYQNYPNPFNPSTRIQYTVDSRQFITIKVYDMLGKEVTTLINKEQEAGRYEIKFDADKYNLSSGVYFYKLKTEGGEITRKMIFLK